MQSGQPVARNEGAVADPELVRGSGGSEVHLRGLSQGNVEAPSRIRSGGAASREANPASLSAQAAGRAPIRSPMEGDARERLDVARPPPPKKVRCTACAFCYNPSMHAY